MPVTLIRSSWSSGDLIFHESASVAPSTTYNVLRIGDDAVQVGDTANDIDLLWYGTTTGTFALDANAHTAVTTGLAWTITGDIALTGDLTLSGDNAITVGSRTAGSGADLATVTTGVLSAVQYTDGATLANTYDYCGMAGIFDLTIGRAITLASGGGYGWAALNGSVTISKAIASTGGLSAGWFAIWAEAAGADAVLSESTRIQAVDAAIVTGAAFNAGASTKVYGVRIDSSINDSATVSGGFSAIHIGKSSGGKDWGIGVEIENCTTGIALASPITSTCTATAAISVTATQTSATPGTIRAIYAKETSHTSMTSGNLVGVRGEITIGGSVSSGVFLYGVQGKLITGANTITAGSGMVCGLFGQFDVTGGTIASGWCAPIHADIYGANSGSYGTLNLISGTHAGGGVINALLSLYGKSDYVFDISSNTHNNVGIAGTVTDDDGYIKVLVDGEVRYIGLGATVA